MQKEAYRLFEKGDIDGALKVLDFSEIEDEFEREIARINNELKEATRKFVRNAKTRIDLLKMHTKIPNRFEEIENLYDKIIPKAIAAHVEYDTICDYVKFLREQNNDKKALEIATRVCDDEGWNTKENDNCRADLCNHLGMKHSYKDDNVV